ncbi:GNAT family N-acetyltransferase [Oceanicoccus sp. KOV_DT_Chl]|uniref:GNAT family N-acetyltransferase n=1 Tax=Oceanicoccus sp. KOV_DT_Chl TaxID=1904639 RepID=UPI000C7AEC8D|nr:GNAT family N-acetyltransferase [Oceanicoccus sp. KOV_DT_Chl]
MRVSFIDSVSLIDSEQWNAITGIDYPFTRHEFLLALETSGATNRETGWQPQHVTVYQSNAGKEKLIAVMPLYLKYHSYGEFVFDWSWADAYRRHGLDYYPKLLSAIPFTPATGPRLCVAADCDATIVNEAVISAIYQHAESLGVSSIHILFPDQTACEAFQLEGLAARHGAQFHWFNQGFTDFDDFLATFSSRKRKNLRKERMAVADQNLTLEVFEGHEISSDIWQRFYYFYQMTYAKRSGHGGYLDQEFFELIGKTIPENLVLVLAYDNNKGGQAIAGALNFRDSKTLYGRYWGCIREFEFLHFEACYYQGIEYCIANHLQRFDPGAQGEHKIQRGFTPVRTYSNHWIAHPDFRLAVDDFLLRDNAATADYIEQATTLLPFKKADQ